MNLKAKNSDAYYLESYTPLKTPSPETDCTQIMYKHILEDNKLTELQDISKPKVQDVCCRCIRTLLHIPSACQKLIKHDNILYKLVHNGHKMFEALVVSNPQPFPY